MCVCVHLLRFELLHVLNFDSVRRRMSVVVKSSSGTRRHTQPHKQTEYVSLRRAHMGGLTVVNRCGQTHFISFMVPCVR